MITEELLLELGFYRIYVPAEESGAEAFYYFNFDPTPGLSLITNSSNEAEKDGWTIEFLEAEELVIKEGVLLRKLMGVFTEILKANGFVGGIS